MSRVKAFLPGTHVVSSSIVLDREPTTNRLVPVIAKETMYQKGHGDLPYARVGDPIWRKPKPIGFVQHFKNAACSRACNGELKNAKPNQLRLVPIYRGVPARLANELRGMRRRSTQLKKAA